MALLNDPQQVAFDAVLLDLSIPTPDGKSLLAPLRAAPLTANSAIIIFSASSKLENRIELIYQGADDYIVKPCPTEELLARVSVQINLNRLRASNRKVLVKENKDLREQEELRRQQLIQSEKLAATGRLAASLAHEINNPLQAIHSSLQLMIEFDLPPEKRKTYLSMAVEEVERLSQLVSHILDFSRPDSSKREVSYINKIIRQIMRLTDKYISHHQWQIEQHFASDLPPVYVVPNQIAQLFLALTMNAFDAMPENGTLRISTKRESDWITIVFRDNGTGIPDNIMEHLFEPFITTKPSATGLSLAIGHSIVQQHGGTIKVRSKVGKGTIFTVRLPIYTPTA
jgi:two-component system NtrC family sensor kinase